MTLWIGIKFLVDSLSLSALKKLFYRLMASNIAGKKSVGLIVITLWVIYLSL